MKKSALFIFGWLVFCIPVFAQQNTKNQFIVKDYTINSTIVKKYHNDTLGFKKYPDTTLLGNLKLSKKYKTLEINTWSTAYRRRGDHRSPIEYKNLARYPEPKEKIADSVVLSPCDPMICFTACWCPDFLSWYISAKEKDCSILTVTDTNSMKILLDKIDNPFKAFLWLRLYDMHEDRPINTTHYFSYKKVKDGFLIAYNSRSRYDMVLADIVCFVGKDFEVVLVSKKHVQQIKGYVI